MSQFTSRLLTAALLTLAFATAALSAASEPRLRLLSSTTGGDTANGRTELVYASRNGRYVAFQSTAADLLPGVEDSADMPDVFLLDTETGQRWLVSKTPDGSPANGRSTPQDVSDDGRFVVFFSEASDLIAGMTGMLEGSFNVYLWDRDSDAVVLVSHGVDSPTAAGNGQSSASVLSADGSRIAFTSSASNLMPVGVDGNGTADVFVYERASGSIQLVSSRVATQLAADSYSSVFAISADGNQVFFESQATNLLATNPGTAMQLYRRDLGTGAIQMLTHAPGAPTTGGNNLSRGTAITPDGRHVLFESSAYNLVAGFPQFPSGLENVYVYDTLTTQTKLASRTASSPSVGAGSGARARAISADGRMVFFSSDANHLVTAVADSNNAVDAFAYDSQLGTVQFLSTAGTAPESSANGESIPRQASSDGRYVLIETRATNLATGVTDANGGIDVYLLDRVSGTRRLLSHVAGAPLVAANGPSLAGTLRADGGLASFLTAGTDLLAGVQDANFADDLLLYDTALPGNSLVTRRQNAATATADRDTSPVELDASGRLVLLSTASRNLVDGITDTNQRDDVYLHDRQTGQATLISHAAGQPLVAANGVSEGGKFSADGRYLVFRSEATDLIAGFVNANGSNADIYLVDRQNGARALVSHAAGSPVRSGNKATYGYRVSADARYVAFESDASDHVVGVTDGEVSNDVFLYDRADGSIRLVSHLVGSPSATANNDSSLVGLSSDGRYLLIESYATNLIAGYVDNSQFTPDIFLYDREADSMTLVSRSAASHLAGGNSVSMAAGISADGRYVAFTSEANNLTPPGVDGNAATDAFLYDRVAGTVQLVSRAQSGVGSANGASYANGIREDGGVVLLHSEASDLVPGFIDANGIGARDAYAWNRNSLAVSLLSRAVGTVATGGNGHSAPAGISADGTRIVLSSSARNLMPGQVDDNDAGDVFLREDNGEIRLLSRARGALAVTGNGSSYAPLIAASGDVVVFESEAANLQAGVADGNTVADAFESDLGVFADGFD